ncbi:MAG: sigma-70 family RNA polymerase sigma factor [Bacteroidales bacterium]
MDDKELLKLYKENNHYGFNLLVDKYSERLYWHIRRMVLSHEETNDILQNSLIKVWKSLSKFRGESNLYTWLYRIATNETLTFLNKKKRASFFSLSDNSRAIEEAVASDPYFEGSEIERRLREAILKLPERQRAVFTMRYFEELKYNEISEILGTTVGSLKASYHHAFKKIEQELKESI